MDNEKKNDSIAKTDEKNIKTTSGKEIKKHLWMFLLVAFGVLLYVALNNLGVFKSVIVYLATILSPILIGSLLALVLNTPMMAIFQLLTWLSKKIFGKKNKDYAPNLRAIEISSLVITVLLALLLIYIIVYAVVPQLIESIKTLVVEAQLNMPEYLKFLDKVEKYGISTDFIKEKLMSIDLAKILTDITSNAGTIIDKLISSASSIISGTYTALTSIVFALYVLANKRKLAVQMKKLTYAHFKQTTVDRGIELCKMTTDTFSNFISGQFLDAVLLGLMCFITMTIFGFPYALPISAMITITAIIPYIGAFLGALFGVLLIVMVSPIKALLFVVMFIVVQQIDNHLVYPRVVGGSVGLPAIWTFVAVIVGGKVWGVPGMILFIPIFSVIYALIKDSVNRRLEAKGIVIEEPAFSEKPKDSGNKKPFFSSFFGKIKAKIAERKNKNKK